MSSTLPPPAMSSTLPGSSRQNRYIVLDDTDPTITYSGSGWFNDTSGSTDNAGIFGPTYQRTLHATSKDGQVSLEFHGSTIEVLGTVVIKDSNNPDPDWQCFIDNVNIGKAVLPPAGDLTNHWTLCRADSLPDGLHTLRIDIQVASNESIFWIDQIRYRPSPGVNLDNVILMILNADSDIQLGEGWGPLGDVANMTSTTGSTATLHFEGTSVSWFAFIPAELPHGPSAGTWSIDGGNPTQFPLQGLRPDAKDTIFNQVYFTIPPLEMGPHILTVTYLGSGEVTPLSLNYIHIARGNSSLTNAAVPSGPPSATGDPLTTAVPNGPPSPTGDPPTTTGHPHSDVAGKIIGGVLGGAALLLVIAVAIFWWRRRGRSAVHDLTAARTFWHDRDHGSAHPDQSTIRDKRVLSGRGRAREVVEVQEQVVRQQAVVGGKSRLRGEDAPPRYTP